MVPAFHRVHDAEGHIARRVIIRLLFDPFTVKWACAFVGCRFSPSSQAPLLGPGPLRTGRETFVLIRLKPFERLFRGDAVFDTERKTLAVNPVVALWMKQNAVICTRGTTQHTRNAVVNAPTR